VLVRLEATWPGRSAEQRSQAWMDRQMGKVRAALKVMSQGLGEKPFCCGGTHLTLADISVGCALAWLDFRFPELDWRAEHPNLAALLTKLAARPSFLNTVPH
jgi:glutathione S-transferase